ncbi:MAG: DnaB-like helicase C-terminal domain-containing protein, partial [Muribaculaceae bacterium]|nr:DnaB-like helicase C-terminal domain-containing protein [Muribaculaceae bacterium]
SGMKFGSREQEVSMISRSLKQLAKELNIPIVALSQLNRSVESRSDNKRPQLSDLRESGAIEQDADMVCFIHRPEYYLHSDKDASGRDIRGLAEFIVAKHRSGAVDDVKMRFRASVARFENWNETSAALEHGTHASRMNAAPDAAGPDVAAAMPGASAMSGGSADFLAPATDDPLPF